MSFQLSDGDTEALIPLVIRSVGRAPGDRSTSFVNPGPRAISQELTWFTDSEEEALLLKRTVLSALSVREGRSSTVEVYPLTTDFSRTWTAFVRCDSCSWVERLPFGTSKAESEAFVSNWTPGDLNGAEGRACPQCKQKTVHAGYENVRPA